MGFIGFYGDVCECTFLYTLWVCVRIYTNILTLARISSAFSCNKSDMSTSCCNNQSIVGDGGDGENFGGCGDWDDDGCCEGCVVVEMMTPMIVTMMMTMIHHTSLRIYNTPKA